MAQGNAAARDLRYGRRGGRWAAGDKVERTLADIHRERLAAIAQGPGRLAQAKGPDRAPWPPESVALWRDYAATVADAQAAGATLTDLEARALEVAATADAAGWPA